MRNSNFLGLTVFKGKEKKFTFFRNPCLRNFIGVEINIK